eukprot:709799-Prymnesium_polylepis.1
MVGVLKLFYFVVERAAEPLSARLETTAAGSERFRRLCGTIANWSNSLEYEKQQRRLARERNRLGVVAAALVEDALEAAPPKLSEQEATELGCQLIGEGFVVGVGLALLLHQEARERAAEEAKEAHERVAEAAQQDLIERTTCRLHELEVTQAVLVSQAAQAEQRAVALECELQRVRAASSERRSWLWPW